MSSPEKGEPAAEGFEGGALEADERWKLVLRVAETQELAKAARLREFLLYVCRNALTGHAQEIHEQQIGVEVFGRRLGYNPAEDNIVRVEARELRRRLDRYFGGEGESEQLRILIPKGSYVPIFESQADLAPGDGAGSISPPARLVKAEAGEAVAPTAGSSLYNAVALPADLKPAAGSAEFPVFGNPAACPSIPTEKPQTSKGTKSAQPGSPRAGLLRVWRIGAAALIAVAALLATIHWLVSTRQVVALPKPVSAAPAERAGIWPLVFPSRSPISLVVADSSLVLIEDMTHHTVSLQDYANHSYQRKLKGPGVAMVIGRPYTDLADVMVTSKLLEALQPQGWRLSVRYPRDLTLRNLENDNLIFLGSAYSDPWIDEFDAQSDFRVARDPATGNLCFANKKPQAGELGQYCAGKLPSQSYETYGLVTFLPNLQQTGSVLILEGTTGAGTEAAGDFITNPHYASGLHSLLGLGSKTKSAPYFQLLLETTVLDNTPGELQVIALRMLGNVQLRESGN